ncbi:MAG: amidohydrolase family protein, partial [Gemmatimonadaceae bacterium]|nr:amidohydrolase family protein [Gemmatimonadaceae bacterium]
MTALLTIALPTALFAQTAMLLRPARVFDGSGSAPVSGVVVLVQNGRITAVGTPAMVKAPSDAVVVDLPGMRLMPRMIGLHPHVLLHPYNETN